MPRTQWVNLPSEDGPKCQQATFTGDDAGSKELMGREVFVEAKFDTKDAAAVATLSVTPDGDNAVYTPAEAALGVDLIPKVNVTDAGVARFRVRLSAAGGDKFKLVVKDKAGTEKQTEELETRRSLYYQVIRMTGMTATEATLTSHLEAEFADAGKKHHIHLNKLASKGDIDSEPNFDEKQQGALPALAKLKYNTAKDPFCFVVLLVDQLAASSEEVVQSGSITVAKGGSTSLRAVGNLWLDLDKAGTPEAVWLIDAVFVEDGTAAQFRIDPANASAASAPPTKEFVVKLDDVPVGTKGIIRAKVKVVNRFRTGLSLGKNIICIATRAFWKQRADKDMKSTLVHEAGHKIGMVPGGDAGGLKKQSTYYSLRGGHCNHGTNTCVMYGEIHSKRENGFCPACSEESVRRLNLDARDLEGFTPL